MSEESTGAPGTSTAGEMTVPAAPSEIATAPDRDELGVTVSANSKWGSFTAAARGFYGGFLLSMVALGGALFFFRDKLSGELLLTVVTALVGGFFLGVGTSNARIRELREHAALCEREIERKARRQKELEELLLANARLSSATPPPPVATGRKRR